MTNYSYFRESEPAEGEPREHHDHDRRSVAEILGPRNRAHGDCGQPFDRHLAAPREAGLHNSAYVICTSPRTGSTLLQYALAATGLAGRPDEYFDIHEENEEFWKARLGIGEDGEYLDRVLAYAKTPNGICGFKIHWHQLESLRAKLARKLDVAANSATDLSLGHLNRIGFGNVRYLWLRRNNKVAQGISYFLACRSGVWRVRRDDPQTDLLKGAELAFDFHGIDQCVRQCTAFDARWNDYFRAQGIAPLVLVYEDFLASYEATIESVLRFLGLEAADARIIDPPLRQQADSRSLDWERQYRAALAARTGRSIAPVRSAPLATAPEPKTKKSVTRPQGAKVSYLICTCPRTGSTLLTDALTSTGVAGRPAESFSIPSSQEADYWMRRFGIKDGTLLLEKIIEAGSSPNGVFGVKLHWQHLGALRNVLLSSPGQFWKDGSEPSLEELIRARFHAPRYVWLRRKNRVAQAISHYRAAHTGVWRAVIGRGDQSNAVDAVLGFDFEKIDRLVDMVNESDWQWGNYFKENRLTPLMIFYEDLIARYEVTVRGILKFLQISDAGIAIASPTLERQADARSMEWEQRYAEMKKAKKAGETLAVSASAPAASRQSDQASVAVASRTSPEPLPSDNGTRLPFIAYQTAPQAAMALVTGPVERAWMNATPKRFAYRCLPMLIANQAGWFILNPVKFTVLWNGGAGLDAIKIEGEDNSRQGYVQSHFGAGVLTFTIPYLFRTPPGFNLHVRGPANSPKDGIYALEGIVETDWSTATFTMNWKMTRPGHQVAFEAGEPIAMLTPVRRGELERFDPAIQSLSDSPEMEAGYREWCRSRASFNAELKVEGSTARQQGWQRHYMRGTTATEVSAMQHQTGLTLRKFTKP